MQDVPFCDCVVTFKLSFTFLSASFLHSRMFATPLLNEHTFEVIESSAQWRNQGPAARDARTLAMWIQRRENGNIAQSREAQAEMEEKTRTRLVRRLEAVKHREPQTALLDHSSFSRLSVCGDSLIRELSRGLLLEMPERKISRRWGNLKKVPFREHQHFNFLPAYGRSYSRPACLYLTPDAAFENKDDKGLNRNIECIVRSNKLLWDFFNTGDVPIGRYLEKAAFTSYRESIWTFALTYACQLRNLTVKGGTKLCIAKHLAKYSTARSEPQLLGRQLTHLAIQTRVSEDYTQVAILLASLGPQLRHLQLISPLETFESIHPRVPACTRLRSLSLGMRSLEDSYTLLFGGPLTDCFPWKRLESLHLEFKFVEDTTTRRLHDLLLRLVSLKRLSLKLCFAFDFKKCPKEAENAVACFKGDHLAKLETFRLIEGFSTIKADEKQSYRTQVILDFLPLFTPLLAGHLTKLILRIPVIFLFSGDVEGFNLINFTVLRTLILDITEIDALRKQRKKPREDKLALDFLYRSKMVISTTVTSLTILGVAVNLEVHLTNIGQAFPSLTELNIERFSSKADIIKVCIIWVLLTNPFFPLPRYQ